MQKLNFVLISLIILSVPLEIWTFINWGNRGIKAVWILALAVILLFILDLLLGKRSLRIGKTGLFIILFNLAALVSLLNIFRAEQFLLSDFFSLWLQLLLYSLLFFAITTLEISRTRIKQLLQLLVLTACLFSVYAIYQMFARILNLPLAYLPITNPSMSASGLTRGGAFGAFVRPSSVFAEPSFFGSYLLTSLILMLVFFLYKTKDRELLFSFKPFNWIVFGFIATAFIITFSMGALIVFFLTALLFFLKKELVVGTLKYGFIALLMAAAISVALRPLIGDYFLKIIFIRARAHLVTILGTSDPLSTSAFAQNSIRERLERTRPALGIWRDHPLLGVGLNNIAPHYPKNVKPVIYSGFIQVLTETGIVGLLLFGLIFASSLAALKKAVPRCRDQLWKTSLTAFTFIIWARLIHMLIAANWIKDTTWIDLSLAVLILNIALRDHEDASIAIEDPLTVK